MSYIEEIPLDDKCLTISIQRVSECGKEIGGGMILSKTINCIKNAQIGDEIEILGADGKRFHFLIQNRQWVVHESRHRSEPHQAWLTIYGVEK